MKISSANSRNRIVPSFQPNLCERIGDVLFRNQMFFSFAQYGVCITRYEIEKVWNEFKRFFFRIDDGYIPHRATKVSIPLRASQGSGSKLAQFMIIVSIYKSSTCYSDCCLRWSIDVASPKLRVAISLVDWYVIVVPMAR